MRTNEVTNKYFYLSQFYTSVFLCVKGLQLVDIDRTNSQRAQFVFLDTPEREELIRQFNFAARNSPEVMVDAREFEQATKKLKDRLYQERE
ncbi:MAG: DUF5659 domain-containing protein [Candidatus Shapirobacteria bacterium]